MLKPLRQTSQHSEVFAFRNCGIMGSKTEGLNFGEAAEDEVCFEGSGSAEDNEFDAIVGALEEILLGDVFQNAQKGFCDEHCDKFTDGEENKIEYTDLFQTYTIIIEKSLDDELKAKIPDFDMTKFEALLVDRKDEIDVEIFDLLMSLGDFDEFKQLMLSHKKEKIAKLNGVIEPLTVFGTTLPSSKTA